MMESIGREDARQQSGTGWRRSAWLVMLAGGLLVLALALAWTEARRAASDARLLAIVTDLQLGVRDVSALTSLAASGNQTALNQYRGRTANLESTLAVLITGGTYKGANVSPAAGSVHARLQEFASRWAELKRRTDTHLAMVAPPEVQAPKEASQRPSANKRPPALPAQRAAAQRGNRPADLSATASSLLSTGHALAGTLDGIRAELGEQPRTPWLLYVAAACVLGSVTALAAFAISIRRSAPALQQASERADTQLLEVLRPAMRTLNIQADAAALADPAALGRRLSDEILAVIDGIKTLVKALDAATAEADKFAVVGHAAARALADAEKSAADAGSSLQATARRIAAIYAAVTASAGEVQQQCARALELVGNGSPAVKNAVRATDRLREKVDDLAKSYAQTATTNSAIAQGLAEVADLLTQAEGFALRASDRLAGARADEAVAFAKDVRGYLGPSVAMLKKTTELVRGAGREAEDFSNALAQATAHAGDAARIGLNGTSALDGVGIAVQELSAKASSLSRLASGQEASQLLAALDEVIRQIAQSSASARQVLDATQNAASRIEELAKLLNTMKPS